MKRRRLSSGFTLLEMLAALAMAGAVMAPLYVITRGIAEQTSSKQQEIEAMQRARVAMDTLIRDFSRAGLFTSPNAVADARYLNGKGQTPGASASFRAAVVHMNPDVSGPDAVMLSGNFLGSNVYRALAVAENQLQIIGEMKDPDDCSRQFDPRYAFAHVSDNSGREMDAEVSDAELTDDICTVTINANDYNTQSFKPGDTIWLSANQTIVYAVENGTLVRYFVDYGSSGGVGACQIGSSVTSAADIPVPGTVLVDTRQVVANYVQDFQVWLRPVTGGDGWVVPHYQTVDTLIGANEDFFQDGLTPLSADTVIPLDPSDKTAVPDVTCNGIGAIGGNGGPERVRSALIRLTVRSEMRSGSLRRLPDDEASRLERHLLAPDTDTPVASGDDPFAYVLRTVTTEVEMPNLTARSDLLPE